jgi:hypothetical protein
MFSEPMKIRASTNFLRLIEPRPSLWAIALIFS